jgi:hypothetical protein
MDTKTLINDSKARFNHNSAKQYLKDKYTSKLIVADQGGLWKATPELIVFLDNAGSEQIVLLDSYENPIIVNDRKALFYKLRDTYNDVMTKWANEWKELEKKR